MFPDQTASSKLNLRNTLRERIARSAAKLLSFTYIDFFYNSTLLGSYGKLGFKIKTVKIMIIKEMRGGNINIVIIIKKELFFILMC